MVFCVILYARIEVSVSAPPMSFVNILQHDTCGSFMVFYAKCCSGGVSSIGGKKIQLMKQRKTGLMGHFPVETAVRLGGTGEAINAQDFDMNHLPDHKGCSQ